MPAAKAQKTRMPQKTKKEEASAPAVEPAKPPSVSTGVVAEAAKATVTVPLQSVAVVEPSTTPKAVPTTPTLVTKGDEASVLNNMRLIVPFVLFHLREKIRTIPALSRQFADIEPHLHAPLDIKDDPSRIAGDDLTSYKQPWKSEQAYASLKGSSMFESSGSVLWVNPYPRMSSEEKVIAGSVPTWQQVVEYSTSEYSVQGGATKSIGRQRNGKVSRFLFRSAISVYMEDIEVAKHDAFNLSLTVLTDFRPILAWWNAMFEALSMNDDGDEARIISLWQAGLCVTLHVRTDLTIAQQAIWSLSCPRRRRKTRSFQTVSWCSR